MNTLMNWIKKLRKLPAFLNSYVKMYSVPCFGNLIKLFYKKITNIKMFR